MSYITNLIVSWSIQIKKLYGPQWPNLLPGYLWLAFYITHRLFSLKHLYWCYHWGKTLANDTQRTVLLENLWTNPLGILVWNRQEPQNNFQSKAGGKFVEGGDISPRHKRKNLITSNVLLMSRFRARSNETLCVNFNLIYLQEPLNFRRTPKRGTPSWLLFRTNERARRGGASRRHRPRYGDLGAEQMRAYRALDISVNAMKTLLRVDQWGICHSWGPEPLWVY